jgi:serine/threonine-protein kinase
LAIVARPSSFPLGSRVARRYVLHAILGQGGSATVYEAEDGESGARIALKILDTEEHRGPERERMLRESRLTASVGHSGIVRVLDGGPLEQGRAYLAMELLRGETLAQRLDCCFWLPIEEAMSIASQLLEALEAAHAMGVVHRDIKPNNVFLLGRDKPCIKVIDFGIGVDLGDPHSRITEPDIVMGTLGYIAPEQLFGDDATIESDIYGAGATIYEMLAGRPPIAFKDGDVASMMGALAKRPAPLDELRPSIPKELSSGVMRALSHRPTERHRSCREMLHACGLDDALAA